MRFPEELLLLLHVDETGYFVPIPPWKMSFALAGGVLMELSLENRIDSDLDSIMLTDPTPTGDEMLDLALEEIARSKQVHTPQYWVERIAQRGEAIIDTAVDRLVDKGILESDDGGFWSLSHKVSRTGRYPLVDGWAGEEIKGRIFRVLFDDEIPEPRDVAIIGLVHYCDGFRGMLDAEEYELAEANIELYSGMDLIARAIALAVRGSRPLRRRSRLTKQIPGVSLLEVLRTRHARTGNLPALFAELAEKHGPVFELRVPFAKPVTFLAGPQINHWSNRHGRMYLRARDYFADFEKVYGAAGVLPALDGTDHFRLRKAMAPAYSRRRLQSQVDQLFGYARGYMADWKVGESYQARHMCRRMINAQISPLSVSVDSQDIFDDLMEYKERALIVFMLQLLPAVSLKTPGMKRRAKAIDTLLSRVQNVHTPAQRAGCPRNLADDLLSINASDPQLVPESNLRFALSAALIASVYLGDAFSFVLYSMASQPEFYSRIRAEADALFGNGDPAGDAFTKDAVDVTQRFVAECLRLYPIVPISVRHVMNSCVVEGYELPVGTRVNIAQTAPHYMEDVFPDPLEFDIDRYLPPRNEHRGPGYAPYGVGTHRCLGFRWMELQLMINLLMIAHHFTLEVAPENYKHRIDPFPSMKPSSKLEFRVAEQVREFPV